MNLQESIRKVLREEYSPAGNEIIPNRIIVHKSNPIWRKNILETGLQVSVGECYKTYVGYGEKCKPAIFATNSTNKRAWFDSTYDDDIWFIDTTKIPDVKWYKDRHFESTKKHIVTFQDIPPEALTLQYEGTGRSEDLLEESIRKVLREETINLTTILRRVHTHDLEIEFEESLDMASDNLFYRIRNGKGVMDLKSFIEVTTSILIDGIHSELYNTLPEDVQWYQDVQESLKEYYRDRIKVRYKKLMSEL